MHIHEAYTKLIAWLETPRGIESLIYSLVSARRGVDKDKAKDKAEQILRDLRSGRLYLRDLRQVAACVVDNFVGLALFLDSPDVAQETRNTLVNEAGGWDQVPHHTLMWDQAALDRARQRNPTRATA